MGEDKVTHAKAGLLEFTAGDLREEFAEKVTVQSRAIAHVLFAHPTRKGTTKGSSQPLNIRSWSPAFGLMGDEIAPATAGLQTEIKK